MARRRAEVVVPTNSLVASAVRYTGKTAPITSTEKDWQREAWRFFSIVPELRFAATWMGNALSRATLYAAEVGPDGKKQRTDDPKVNAILDQLFHGKDGQEQMLSQIGIHLTVAGEAYLVGRAINGVDTWEVIGTRELRPVGASRWQLNIGDGLPAIFLDATAVIIRIWRPHPAARIEADSPVRTLLGVLEEIETFDLHIKAQSRSRLAGNGVWVLPQSVQFPPAPKGVTADPDNPIDGFIATLAEVASIAIKKPGDPEALIPIIITVPDEQVENVKDPVHFWSAFDDAVVQGRKDAITRFCVGMDMPPEIILGMTSGASSGGGTGTGVSHWGQWQIEESAIKMHVEPLLELIVNSITVTYLREASENAAACLAYDTSSLKLQPDRSQESLELYDRGELSAKAMRRYNGIDEGDAPTLPERKAWLLMKIASGSATPDQVEAALKMMGLDLGVGPQDPRDALPPGTNTAPTLEDHPSRSMPDTRAALFAASEVLVYRALERAGNRMRNTGTKPSCPAHQTYLFAQANGNTDKLLEDAWSCVSQVTEGLTDDVGALTHALDSYCRALLKEQAPHSRDRLKKYLELV